MAGIYLHIPFCKKACHYCDFHFSTSLSYKDELLAAMHQELKIRNYYLGNETIDSIYFGGGTPSLIGAREIQRFLDSIFRLHPVSSSAEITLEANPDDLNPQTIQELKNTRINRFSIGVQSFFEEDLKWMNRAHNSAEAEHSIKGVQDAGFENITIDLIYGYPLLSDQKWLSNIEKSLSFDIPHVSAYGMTVEPRTALAAFIKKGLQSSMSDSQGAAQYITLIDTLSKAGFEHYEISNFAKASRYSIHNTNYWRSAKYLGIGPSAHSYNVLSRQWNIASNSKYISSLRQDLVPCEIETLSQRDSINEYIMTALRTMWGIDLIKVEKEFGVVVRNDLVKSLSYFIGTDQVEILNDKAILKLEGKLFADRIASELFIS